MLHKVPPNLFEQLLPKFWLMSHKHFSCGVGKPNQYKKKWLEGHFVLPTMGLSVFYINMLMIGFEPRSFGVGNERFPIFSTAHDGIF